MSRPRGYNPDWRPQPATRLLIDQVKEILHEYRAHLPMTARQIFYRLVGTVDYPKDERAYARLCETLVKARRSEMVSFSSIRDDGTKAAGGDWGYDSPEEFWEEIRESAGSYRRRITEGQPKRIELWCEAAGMVPQLERVAAPFGARVYSTGGFSSVTVTHEIAQRAIRADQPTVFLHVGDYDPSGESIFNAMAEDADAFIYGESAETLKDGQRFTAERVALTEAQVAEHSLPTAPPKRSDSRSRNWAGETCQCEAMPPDLLASTIEEAIEAHFDYDIAEEARAKADQERIELEAKLAEAMA